MLFMLKGLFHMLNNKGQTLVLFVVILPVLLLLLVLIIDVGKMIMLKLELNNISEIVLDYGIDNLDKENVQDELVNLVHLNKKNIDKVDVSIVDDKIYIDLEASGEGLFSGVVNATLFTIETNYVGYMNDGEKRIERIGD